MNQWLSDGFRPFFALAGLHAAVVMPLWMALLHGLDLPGMPLTPLAWHAHEMLFGFVTAAMAGFLLTAVPSWTGTAPARGGRLALLVALWLSGRLAMSLPLGLPTLWLAALDVSFCAALTLYVGLAVVGAAKYRQLVVVVVLATFTFANGLFHWRYGHAEVTQPATRFALMVMAFVVALVGGRVVPAFTGNWLRARGDGAVGAWSRGIDGGALLATAAAAVAEGLAPNGPLAAATAAVAALLLALRLARWRGLATLRSPILFVLHVAYAWLPLAFALKALAAVGLGPAGASWTHALLAGAFSTMILAVMSRATLGHTGRPLRAAPATVAAYLLVTAAALLRVFGPAVAPGAWTAWLAAAALMFMLAFVLFLVVHLPMFAAARVDTAAGLPAAPT